MNEIIMTFDVLEVNRREIKLTGDTNLIFKILNPTSEMIKTARENDVVAVVIEDIDSKNIITSKKIVALHRMMELYKRD